jgi:putative peptidoglycan lipid II flippase
MLNVAVMGAAFWLAPWFERHGITPVYALAVGVMLGGVLQLAIQWPALSVIGSVPHVGRSISALRAAWAHPGVSRILRQMAPAVLGVSVAQLSLLINTQIASHVGVGAVSWLTYADRLMEFPTALLGVALGVVLLPQLSAAQARRDGAGYSSLLDWGLRLVVLLALPCALALLIFPDALVAGLYHYGRFSAGDLHQTTSALMGYGVGLMGLIAVKVLAPGFYAQQDIRTPVRIAVVVLVMTQLMNLALVPLLGHAGLALSIGIGALLNAGLLLFGLRREGTYTPEPGWRGFLARALTANVACGISLAWAAQGIDWIGLGATDRLLRASLLVACLAGVAAVYFLCLRLLGVRLRDFVRR